MHSTTVYSTVADLIRFFGEHIKNVAFASNNFYREKSRGNWNLIYTYETIIGKHNNKKSRISVKMKLRSRSEITGAILKAANGGRC